MRSSVRSIIAVAVTGVFLSACGGGGGSGSVDSGSSGNGAGTGNGGGTGGGTGGPVMPQLSVRADLLVGEPGGSALLDGQGEMARFWDPQSIVVDSKGNVFVRDNLTIRKITPDGQVSVFAGTPFYSREITDSGNPSANTVAFSVGTAMAIDTNDNLFVASGYTIKKVTPQGQVSNYASLSNGYMYKAGGAPATTGDIVIDSKGNIYYYDGLNQQVNQIAVDGTNSVYLRSVDQVDGARPASGRPFLSVVDAITIDANDKIYLADNLNGLLISISPDKIPHIVSGSFNIKKEIGNVTLLRADSSGNLYTIYLGAIQKIEKSGITSPFLGTPNFSGGADGPRSTAMTRSVSSMFWTAQGEMVFTDKRAVRKLDKSDNVTTVAGKNSSLPRNGADPKRIIGSMRDIAVSPDQRIYIADGNLIRELNLQDKTFNAIPAFSSTPGNFYPSSISVDKAGNLFFTDDTFNLILQPDSQGNFKHIGGSGNDRSYGMRSTKELRLIRHTTDGRTIVVDGNMLRQLNADGSFSDIAGANVSGVATDGIGSAARFVNIRALTTDSKGNAYIIESDFGARIRTTDKDGKTSLYAGSYSSYGQNDGPLMDTRFICPAGITRDDNDNLYVADTCANSIRMITKDGKTYTLKIQWSTPDGKQYQTLPSPSKIIWSAGKLFVYADTDSDSYGALFQIGIK